MFTFKSKAAQPCARHIRNTLAAIALLLAAKPAFACSSCGCTLSPDWVTQNYTTRPGFKLDMRYDFVDQNNLRRDTGSVSGSSLPLPNAEEVQRVTRTQFLNLGLDYSPNRDWGFRLDVPLLDRFHTTVAPGDTAESKSDTSDLGDIRVTARYQGFFEDKSTGVELGLKLPTGSFHQSFDTGPAAGETVDRGLQAGTGTTDLIVGVYNIGYLTENFARFAQLTLKTPFNSREDFKPGTAVNANVGVSYLGLGRWVPQFQLNGKIEGRDSGEEADRPNSGSRVVYASPGLTLQLPHNTQAYTFVQLPLYQDYNGLQLAPRYTASLGLRYSF